MPSECDEFGREVPFGSKQRAASPPPFEHHEELHHRKSRRSGESPLPRQRIPCENYVREPMLCQYVWKEQAQQEMERQSREGDVVLTEDDLVFDEEAYDKYRERYCVNYIQEFFNQHMDDSWFRNRYSPLDRKRVVLQHLERSALEAHRIYVDLMAEPAKFVDQARLGYGMKNGSTGQIAVPNSHVLSIWDRVVKLKGIPPHLSEKQIILALLDHSSNPNAQIRIFSEAVKIKADEKHLYRDAFCVFESAEVKNDIISAVSDLKKREAAEGNGHVPRLRDKDEHPKSIPLDVECADPYGRLEVDDEAGGTVPNKKATIFIAAGGFNQKVTVLSAALSSKTRITKDKDSAILMARALDHKHKIPDDYRLDNLIQTLSCKDEDTLDVSIAYLRRVHLFSFYNGCVFSDNLADVLSDHHPASSIHLRLKDADELLQTNKGHGSVSMEVEESQSITDDLLVKRLDESIRRAQENITEWMTNEYYVSSEVDAEASEIEELEKQRGLDWVQQHSLDVEGRARCGFHFCRKLFKGNSFLEKHLFKKHSEFLQAEIAKCHDKYMMKAWESGDIRPVPPILVDCGSKFGLVSSQVIGAARPLAEDPEPDLWKEKQRLDELELQREAQRHRHRHPRDNDGDGDGPPPRRSDFEDVDDMKEEKVELSFDNVDVPVQPPKKKKRKKLL